MKKILSISALLSSMTTTFAHLKTGENWVYPSVSTGNPRALGEKNGVENRY